VKTKKSWFAILLSAVMIFSLIAGVNVEAKGKEKHEKNEKNEKNGKHGKKPLKQWEAVGYAAHIAGWDESNEESLTNNLSYKELITLANQYLGKMKTENWFEDGYSTNKAASKSWTMHLWVNALAEREEWTLDWDQIDELELAQKLGLTDRHPNGKYQPNKPIKNEEVSKLLDRLSDLSTGDFEFVDTTTYTGVVTEINAYTNTFKANVQNGTQTTSWNVIVTNEVSIIYNNQVVPFSTIGVGDQVKLLMKDNKLTKVVIVSHIGNLVERTGEISAISEGTNGKLLTIVRTVNSNRVFESFTVTDTVKIYVGQTEIGFSNLRAGDNVKLTFQNNVLSRIDVLSSVNTVTEGEITSVGYANSTTTFNVRDANNINYVYTVNDSQEVLFAKWKLKATDLLAGDKVKITTNRSLNNSTQIASIEITDRAAIIKQGVLQSVIYPTTLQPLGKLTLSDNNQVVELYWTSDTALITQNNTLTQLVQKPLTIVGKGNVATSIIYNP
jgi:hypothetical protein